jgi:hypothetical protein
MTSVNEDSAGTTACIKETVRDLMANTRNRLCAGGLEREYASLEQLGPAPGVHINCERFACYYPYEGFPRQCVGEGPPLGCSTPNPLASREGWLHNHLWGMCEW